MKSERQSEPAGVDLFDDVTEVGRLEPYDVQDRAEVLVFEYGQGRYLHDRRCDIGSRPAFGGEGALPDRIARCAQRLDMTIERPLRLGIDHRSDIGGKNCRIADHQRLERAADHGEHPVGNIFLHEQDAQGGASLTRALKSGRDHVARDLFRQS